MDINRRNFIYAVKNAAKLVKALSLLQSIGLMAEGSGEDSIGYCIWEAITNSTNIALELMGYDGGDETANAVFSDFIERYNENDLTDDDIMEYYQTYKKNK